VTRRSITPERYRSITLGALALLAFIIVTGAAVRLSGSGLGCSDWPTCEQDQFVAEVDDVHAMIEFVNRVITGLVSLAVVAAVLGSMRRAPQRSDLTLWSWGLVAGVIAQIILGALVVREHLPPQLVMGHFLLSMVLVWNAMVLHHRAHLDDRAQPVRELPRIQRHVRLLTLLATVVFVTGTVVTGAGPHSGSESQETRDALEARGIDVTQLDAADFDVERLPFDVADVARLHSLTVMILLAGIVGLALQLRSSEAPADLFRRTQTLLTVAVAQAALGYVQFFSDVPALLVGVHVGGATGVWVATVSLHLQVRHPRHLAQQSQTPPSDLVVS
jgi:cytochrome c oxidase assembly protein subunit 15